MIITIESDKETVSGQVFHADSSSIPIGPIDATEFLNKLEEQRSVNIGLLPPAVRWISQDRQIVVFERPPMKQLVSYVHAAKESITEKSMRFHKEDFILSIPWTVYVIAFNKQYYPFLTYVYTRPTPLTSFDDRVYLLPLYNMYSDSKLCPPTYEKYEGPLDSLGVGCNYAYNAVWNSGWNHDLQDALNMGYSARMPVSTGQLHKAQNVKTKTQQLFLQGWSMMSMEEVLSAQFPDPAPHTKSKVGAPITLSGAIAKAQAEIATDTSITNTFMVAITSSMF